MAWIKRGFMHLLNNQTSTLTISESEFDLIEGQFGWFLEKNVDKLLKNHNRVPGSFKESSDIKCYIERYNTKECNLYDVSKVIAEKLFKKRANRNEEDKTALFIMRVDDESGQYIIGVEFRRMEKYQIDTKSGRNNVILNPMLLSNATPKKSAIFTIKLNDLEVSVMEPGTIFADEVLQADMRLSMNRVAYYARKCLYNVITVIEGRETDLNDIIESCNKDKIERVNKFENSMCKSIAESREVDFISISEEVFFDSAMLRGQFIKRMHSYRIPLKVKSLSDAKIANEFIIVGKKKKEKRVKLKSGIEVIIPDDVEDIGPINLIEVDGVFREVNEDVE